MDWTIRRDELFGPRLVWPGGFFTDALDQTTRGHPAEGPSQTHGGTLQKAVIGPLPGVP